MTAKDIYVLLPFQPNKDRYVHPDDIKYGFAINE